MTQLALPTPLLPLAAYPQFVVWRAEWNAGRSKWDKIPYSVRGYKASSTDPKGWSTLEAALATTGYDGVGFVFTAADPFWFLDIDGAWTADEKHPAGGEWSPLALELCARLGGVARETSHSCTGLHLIGTGALGFDHANRNNDLHLDFFTKERFVALTLTDLTGDAGADRTAEINAIAAQYFVRPAGSTSAAWTTGPCAEWVGPADDGELLDRALRSGTGNASSAFGGTPTKASFADLFTANADVLGAIWPADRAGELYNASHADQSMANHLAFWTGRDCERIERMMRMSELERPKWDRDSYIQGTILKACGLVQTVYVETPTRGVDPGPPPTAEALEDAGMTHRDGGGLPMLAGAQIEHFAGCVYVTSINKILTPRGHRLDQARFNANYGGHEFVIDPQGKKLTRSAWDAFTENENFAAPTADRLCFRPELGSGGLVQDGGEILANSYVAIDVPAADGDVSRFLTLMERQLPDARDRAILLNYMASVVQNPGMKAQWWPVLQGLKGNGKTVYLTLMEYAVGARYTHLPGVGKMVRNGMNFNGWIDGKLFLGLEEIKGAHRREFFEEFKTTVTNRRLPIEGKGLEEATGDNRANGIMTTNHQDGVPIEKDERRYAVFFMRQQAAGDLQRDGLDAAFFSDFHDWLFGRETHAAHGANYGLRCVTGYLRAFKTDAALDPNRLAIWAPVTTSTADAIVTSRGRVEQEVAEAIEEGRVGFAGGWVSSTFLGRLLDQIRAPLPHNKRRDLMLSLGYDYHPALEPSGRTNNLVQPDNGKPRLYVRAGHLALNATSGSEVARLYSAAQDKAGTEATAAAFGAGK